MLYDIARVNDNYLVMSENLVYRNNENYSWCYGGSSLKSKDSTKFQSNCLNYGALYRRGDAVTDDGSSRTCPSGWNIVSYEAIFGTNKVTKSGITISSGNFSSSVNIDIVSPSSLKSTSGWTTPGKDSLWIALKPTGFYNGSDYLNLDVSGGIWLANKASDGKRLALTFDENGAYIYKPGDKHEYSVRCMKKIEE